MTQRRTPRFEWLLRKRIPRTERRRKSRASSRLIGCGLILVGLLVTALPASARILKTRMNRPGQPRELPLTIGTGFEYDSDSELSELGVPGLIEYGLARGLTLTVEPFYSSIHTKQGGAVSGFGDLETSVTYEFLTERRHRPSVAALGLVKWPTATNREFGTGKADQTLGLLVAKSYVQVDLELSASYTFVGSAAGARQPNTVEFSFAAERDLTPTIDLLGEIVTGGGGAFGASTAGGRESEGTLGLAEQLTERLKLEEGVVLKPDGTWQLVFGWEWEFGSTE